MKETSKIFPHAQSKLHSHVCLEITEDSQGSKIPNRNKQTNKQTEHNYPATQAKKKIKPKKPKETKNPKQQILPSVLTKNK